MQKLDDDQFNVRGDWLINEKHSLFGRYSWQKAPLSPASLAPLGGALVDTQRRLRSGPAHFHFHARRWSTSLALLTPT